jgi:DNA-binding transcriptional MerR regulator
MVSPKNEFFTTEQVAGLLGLTRKDKWRVVKFAESREYGIQPSVTAGSGPGSRRLYDIEDVCRIAVALRLLETGLRPKVIGEIIGKLRTGKERLSSRLTTKKEVPQSLYLAISRQPRIGKPLKEERFQFVDLVERISEIEDLLDEIEEHFGKRPDCDLLIVSLGRNFQEISENLRSIEKKSSG